MRESNPEKKYPSKLETKPVEKKDPVRELGKTAIKGDRKK